MKTKKIICMLTAAALCAAALLSCSHESGRPNDETGALMSEAPKETNYIEGLLDEPGKVSVREREPAEYIKGVVTGCTWGSTVFWINSGIWYQDVNNLSGVPLPLDNDAIGSDENYNFHGMEPTHILVDEKATKENEGFPILLICGTYIKGYSEDDSIVYTASRIGFFDTKTNKWTEIADGIDGDPIQFALFRDVILFVTYVQNEGYTLQKINRDGSGYDFLDNDGAGRVELAYASGDRIYYIDRKYNALYSCGTGLGTGEKVCDGVDSVEAILDGYIYYSVENENNVDDLPDLYRRRLDGGDGELVIKNAAGDFYGVTFYYYTAVEDDVGEVHFSNELLLSYNTETGERKTIFDIRDKCRDENGKILFGEYNYIMSDTYIICQINDRSTPDQEFYLSCIDLETGREWMVCES